MQNISFTFIWWDFTLVLRSLMRGVYLLLSLKEKVCVRVSPLHGKGERERERLLHLAGCVEGANGFCDRSRE